MSSMNSNSEPAEMSQRSESKECLQSLIITTDKIDEATRKTRKIKSKSSAFICRVPEELRKLKESAYTPRLVSIGPLHCNANHLNPHIQDIKLSYLDALLRRMTDKEGRSGVLSNCREKMKKLVSEAKKFYAEQVESLNEDMLVIDGCFILELLYRHYNNKNCKQKPPAAGGSIKESSNQLKHKVSPRRGDDPIFGSRPTRFAVQHDLLLLENQLPFFVLEQLFSLTVDCIPNRPLGLSLSGYVLSYFGNVMRLGCDDSNCNATNCSSTFGNSQGSSTSEKYGKVTHILHLLHKHYLPRPLTNQNGHIEFVHSAADLDYAGVKFVAGNGNDPFGVKFTEPQGLSWWFKRAHFEIPNFCIYEYSTEPFLRNLIAFEQCCPVSWCYVTSYAFLMDRLINTAKDVEVLEKAGVICNYLGAHEEASDLFNKLCKEVFLGDYFYFAETCKQAAAYSNSFWPAAMAHLRRNYLATPWTIIAFCVAFIVFGVTVGNFLRNLLK